MATNGRGTGPVVVGFDGSALAERALRESAPLLGAHTALVVTVWEAGLAYDAAAPPFNPLESPAGLDVRPTIETDLRQYDAAKHTAQRGATIARRAGYRDATGLAVADDLAVADTLIRLAKERRSPGIVVGSHGRRGLTELLLGSTSRTLIRRAPCPVVVVRGETG
jgi:nucleotide-binding universal stress UspA family protein